MPLSNAEKTAIVTAALRDHLPHGGSGSDARSLAALKAEFLKRHLDSLVRSYQRALATTELEVIPTETVN